jgi:DNA repair protein RAD50
MPLHISNENELKTAWEHYMEANDRWKNIEAQKQAKLEIKVCSYKLHVS